MVDRASRTDLVVIGGYDGILKKPFLSAPKHGVINTHLGLLPQNRGCCPTLWAQLHGRPQGFTTYLVAWMRIQACKSVRPSTTAPSSTCLRLPGLVDWCRTIARFTMSWRKQPYNDFSPHWSASLQAKNWHRAKALTSTTRRACPMMAGFHFTGVMTS
ncbi:fmt [Symbiodinium microadriaticum]|nr:fmt [Symbiodinium microadriaticum]